MRASACQTSSEIGKKRRAGCSQGSVSFGQRSLLARGVIAAFQTAAALATPARALPFRCHATRPVLSWENETHCLAGVSRGADEGTRTLDLCWCDVLRPPSRLSRPTSTIRRASAPTSSSCGRPEATLIPALRNMRFADANRDVRACARRSLPLDVGHTASARPAGSVVSSAAVPQSELHDLGAASQALGHSDLSTTAAIYGHYDLSDLERAMDARARARREQDEPAD
jgi:hypothetical protein